MSSLNTTTAFGDRLKNVLARRGEQATQAWLADRSGIDRSLLSRILSNDRLPTIDTLRALAPALEIDIGELVAGTPAEDRLEDAGNHVRRSDYEEAVGKVIEFESKIRDLEATRRSLDEALRGERDARRAAEECAVETRSKLKRAEAELASAQESHHTQARELERYKTALQRALSQFSALKTRVDELQKELGKTNLSSKVGAVLAGVAAVAGVATLAHFMGDEVAPKKGEVPSNDTKRD